MNFFPSNNDKILIDDVGKYSISLPEKSKIITNLISKYMNNNKNITITDAMACIGGDTLSFANTFIKVNAIETDKVRFDYLKHNMNLFNVTNIEYYNEDYLNLYYKLKQDVIYIDPPWGGPEYKFNNKTTIKLGEYNLVQVVKKIRQLNNSPIFIKLPGNYDMEEFSHFNYNIDKKKNYFLISIF